MFHMPMSSPMITTMLGFCCCCAEAGKLVAARTMLEANAVDIKLLSHIAEILQCEFHLYWSSLSTHLASYASPSASRHSAADRRYKRLSEIARPLLCNFGRL